MKRRHCLCIALLAFLGLTCLSYSQTETEGLPGRTAIQAGLGFEYLNQTVSWDDGDQESNLKSYMITLNGGIEIIEGFTLGAFVGFASSNLDSLVFRELPISLEMDAGSINGFALGGEAEFTLFSSYDFEIGIIGQYIYFSGKEKEWEIPGLSVEGTATGKPKWQRARIGVSFEYKGFDYFYPYASVYYNRLRGNFEMQESIEELAKTEDKDIKGKANFGVGLGGTYEFTESIKLTVGADIMPYSGGIDFGGIIRILFEF
ncbi:MAG: autotransporter domain-containing protein [Candidatus Aminicenantes bacterium]|nr:autotransporter domain-containing protein [Candidatus Aminicenantes bacterium]